MNSRIAKVLLIVCLLATLIDARNTKRARKGNSKVRIGLGQPVQPDEFPWTAVVNVDRSIIYHGGTIIGPQHILTTSRFCCEDPKEFTVIVGESVWDAWSKATRHEVESVYTPEEWDAKTDKSTPGGADIKLLKLKEPLVFREANGSTRAIKPINLYSGEDPEPGEILDIAGFGADARLSDIPLLKGEKKIGYCQGGFDSSLSICAYGMYNEHAFQSGDEGNGLVTKPEPGKPPELVGILSSWTMWEEDGELHRLDIFTKVSTFIPWIKEKMRC